MGVLSLCVGMPREAFLLPRYLLLPRMQLRRLKTAVSTSPAIHTAVADSGSQGQDRSHFLSRCSASAAFATACEQPVKGVPFFK